MMRVIHRCLLGLGAIACMLGAGPAFAEVQSLADIFRSANEAFFRGDAPAAAKQYERLIAAGVEDPDVYFNLGVARAHGGELGAAIVCFEKAQRLAPGEPDTLSALATARAALGKRRAESQGEATVETRPPLIEGLVQAYQEDTLAVGLLLFDVLLFGLLIALRFARADTVKTAISIAAATSLLGVAALGSALLVKRGTLAEGARAIVLREGAELREGPDPRARARGRAHEGARAEVLRREGSFLRVRVHGGADGWMQQKDVGIVDDRLTP